MDWYTLAPLTDSCVLNLHQLIEPAYNHLCFLYCSISECLKFLTSVSA